MNFEWIRLVKSEASVEVEVEVLELQGAEELFLNNIFFWQERFRQFWLGFLLLFFYYSYSKITHFIYKIGFLKSEVDQKFLNFKYRHTKPKFTNQVNKLINQLWCDCMSLRILILRNSLIEMYLSCLNWLTSKLFYFYKLSRKFQTIIS